MAAKGEGAAREVSWRRVVELGALALVAASLANTFGLILDGLQPTPEGQRIESWSRVIQVARSSDLTSAAIGAVALIAVLVWNPLSSRGRVVVLLVSAVALLLAFSGVLGVLFQISAPEAKLRTGFVRLTSALSFASYVVAAAGLGAVLTRVNDR